MADSMIGPVVLGFLGTAGLSLPLALAIELAARRTSGRRAFRAVIAAAWVPVLIGVVVVGLVAGIAAAVSVLAVALAATGALVLLPIALGQYLINRRTDLGKEASHQFAVRGCPIALWMSVIVFVAPVGVSRFDATFVTGPRGWIAVGGIAAIIVVGPGLIGLNLARFVMARWGRAVF